MLDDDNADEGAIAATFAILLGGLVIVGMAAMVVDLGQLFAERRVLRNAADNAAIAVGQRCANMSAKCTSMPDDIRAIVDQNSTDGTSQAVSVCGWAYRWATKGPLSTCSALTTAPHDCETQIASGQQYARVYVSTKLPSGRTSIPLSFAPALVGGSAYTNGVKLQACGQAVWGGRGDAQVLLPVAIGTCSFVMPGTLATIDLTDSCSGRATLSGVPVPGTATSAAALWCDTSDCTAVSTAWTAASDRSCTQSHSLVAGDVLDYVAPSPVTRVCPSATATTSTGATLTGLSAVLYKTLGQSVVVPIVATFPAAGSKQVVTIVSFAKILVKAFAVRTSPTTLVQSASGVMTTWTTASCSSVCLAGIFALETTAGGKYSDPVDIPDFGIQTVRLVP